MGFPIPPPYLCLHSQKNIVHIYACTPFVSPSAPPRRPRPGQPPKRPVDYANLFIGTSNSRWMLGPYAQMPFGMVQLGPDNRGDVWMGGYEYSIANVSDFSHLHA
ncbi:hypothetical protein [Alistipes sp.]|uniref:hypothetical protein n=1 Tax=Alistipes sp. TaxID=1872444 RepID=UPI000E999D3D|nr:hypothetical protein [Alistipes sp.]HBX90683.1 hypothetical protein [Alistipes sp.]HCN12959.1 hypothetical protein [Alistipes sp.]